MKILYCMTAYPPSTGGAQTHIHQLAQRFIARHSVNVVCHWSENRTDWLRGVTVHAPQTKAYVQDGVRVQQLNFNAKEKKQIGVWAWAYYFMMGTSVRILSDALFRKLEQQVGEVDVVHVGRIGREFLAWAALKLARKRNVPFVLTPFHHPRWIGWRYRWYLRLYRQADAVMALTHAEKKILADLGVAEEKIHVIGHAPVLSVQKPTTGYFKTNGPVVLFLGQKYAYKGLEQLLQSMSLVWQARPDVRFAFLGPRTAYSKKIFKQYNDTRVIEKDRVSEDEKLSALADCAVFCLPSRQESFGGVYTEAWLMGKPVVGSTIPAVAELITPGVDGEIVGESAKELATSLLTLLQDPARAQQMGEAGRRKVLEKYTWENLVRIQETVYKQVCKG